MIVEACKEALNRRFQGVSVTFCDESSDSLVTCAFLHRLVANDKRRIQPTPESLQGHRFRPVCPWLNGSQEDMLVLSRHF